MVPKMLAVLTMVLGLSSGTHALRNRDGLRRIRPTTMLASAESKGKALALRGGAIDTETLINGMAAINIIQGMSGWLAPKKTMESYGVTELSDDETSYLRFVMGINILTGVTMLAEESNAVVTCILAWGMATAANVPFVEKMGAKKEGLVSTIVFFLGLGELARQGKISSDLLSNILSFMLVPMSVFEIASPQTIFKGFGLSDPSPLGASLFENFSFTKLNLGLFMLVSKLTGKRGLGLAAMSMGQAASCLRTYSRADKCGIKKGGIVVWSALCVVIGALALKNEVE